MKILKLKNKYHKKYNMWRLWCKALGEKAMPDDKEADKVATSGTSKEEKHYVFLVDNV